MFLFFSQLWCVEMNGVQAHRFSEAIYTDVNTAYLAATDRLSQTSALEGVRIYDKEHTAFFSVDNHKFLVDKEDLSSVPLHLLTYIQNAVNKSIEEGKEVVFTGTGKGGHTALSVALNLTYKSHATNQLKIVTFPYSQLTDDVRFGSRSQKSAAYEKIGQKNILRFTYNYNLPALSTCGQEIIGVPIALLRYETNSITTALAKLISGLLLSYQLYNHRSTSSLFTASTSVVCIAYLLSGILNDDYLKNRCSEVLGKVMNDIQSRYSEEMGERDLDKLGTISIINSKRGLLSLLGA